MKKIIILCCLFVMVSHPGGAEAYDLDSLQIHGFISQGYLKSSANNYFSAKTEDGSMQFNEAGFNIATNVNERLRVGLQLLARDFGEYGNNEVELDWAVADYRLWNELGIRAGKLKRQMGLYNYSRDIDAARTSILLPTGIYLENYREAQASIQGVGLYGFLPGGFDYQLQYGTLDIRPDGAGAKMIDNALNIQTQSMDVDESYVVNLEWNSPLDGLKLGGTLYENQWIQHTNIGGIDTSQSAFIVSTEFVYNAVTIAAEYSQTDLRMDLGPIVMADVTMENYYGLFSYRLLPWFELGIYYSESYQNKDDKDGDFYKKLGRPAGLRWLKDFALTFRFDIDENWICKLEGHLIDGLMGVEGNDADMDENWYLFGAKLTYSF